MQKYILIIIGALFCLPLSAGRQTDKQVKALSEETVPVLSSQEQRRFDYFFIEAVRQKQQGNYDAAYELIRHCLSINPESAVANHELMQYYLFLNKVPEALAALEKAVQNDLQNYWYANTLVNLYMQQKKVDEAAALMEQMAVRFPNKLDIYYGLLDVYTSQEAWEKELRLLNVLEERVGKSEQLSMQKFRIYMQQGNQKRAFKEIKALMKEYPDDLRYRIALGDAYMESDKLDDAYAIYQDVLNREPDNVQAMSALLAYYERSGEEDKMEQQLDTLLLSHKVPDAVRFRVMQQYILVQQKEGGDSLKVINRFEQIMAQEPDDPQIPLIYAQYLLEKGMQEKAGPVLHQVLDLTPDNASVRLTLLQYAIKNNDYGAIINLCEGGVLASPDRIEFYFYLAIGYHHEQRLDDALAVCRKALNQANQQVNKEILSDFYAIMGDILHTQQKDVEAYEAYEEALKYNADNISALNNYAYYLSLEKKNLDRAEEMSYKTVKAEPDNATYLDTYAWILYEKGKYAEARIYIDQAIKNLKEDSSVVLEHGGDIHLKTGDPEGAHTCWQKAMEAGDATEELKERVSGKLKTLQVP
ncbi:MAG: tetratricopeptide repeat protein [Bacteroidales bacterium]|nr:tetratricopeptide repeat protein [Bacteroidales bacterium]